MITKKDFYKKLHQLNGHLEGSVPYQRTYQLTIKQRFEGQTLLEVYAQMFPNVPLSVWEQKIRTGFIVLDHQKLKPNQVVRAGQISSRQELSVTEPEVSLDLKFVFSDQDFLVLNKPSPLPIHSAGQYHKNTLVWVLKRMFGHQQFYPVHRLDANTTGVVVLGLHSLAASALGGQLQHGGVTKEYLALVHGVPRERFFESSESISQAKNQAGSRNTLSGRSSQTQFEVLRIEPQKSLSLLKILPITGRTNQIRVHLAQLGFPIVGDVGYQNPGYFETHPLTYPTDSLFLHAHKFGFVDQRTQKPIVFEAEIPQKFLEAIDCSGL